MAKIQVINFKFLLSGTRSRMPSEFFAILRKFLRIKKKLRIIKFLENYLMRKVLSGKIKIRFLYKGITRGYVMRNGRNGMGNWRVGMLLGVRKGMVWD